MERLWLKAACSERNITKASAPMRRNGPIFTLLYSARTRPNAIHVQSLAEAEEFVRRQRGLEVAIFLENVVPMLFIERGTGAIVPIVEFWRASNFDRASYRVPQGSFFVPPAVVKMRTNNVRLRMRTAPDSTGKQVTIAAIANEDWFDLGLERPPAEGGFDSEIVDTRLSPQAAASLLAEMLDDFFPRGSVPSLKKGR